MDELLSEFIAETQETLEALASEVVAWEADPGDRERLDAVFRFFHTVKGSCGFLNLPRFEKLSHAAEDVLSEVRAGETPPDAATISAVLAVMDRIAELCAAVAAGESLPQENDDLLIHALHHCYAMAGMAPDESEESAPTVSVDLGLPTRSGASRTIRLPIALIDQLMSGVSDMVLARNELSRKLRDRDADAELEMVFERLSSCIADMRDSISKTRMQRVERLFMAIPRMVRDLSRDLGKSIDLVIEGGDVEMDREMVEMVVDPLTHIVRNSIDHGIETPDQRRAVGKAATGHLRLSARQSGSQIVIEVSDDGRGIDVEAVARKVVEAGVMSAPDVARLSERERLDLIFNAGLSTAREVTAVSGRGVGMDVVRTNIERIGGTIALANDPGRGLTITMRVPLTLTIIPGLILNAGGQCFAIPRSAVIEILHDNNAMVTITRIGGASVAKIRGARYSMIDLETVLGLPLGERRSPRSLMLVRSASGTPYALAVSGVENHEELVIRPAAPMLMASGIYAGMTLPDNGKPMLLLDAGGIAQIAGLPAEQPSVIDDDVAEQERTEQNIYTALHFVELSGEDRLIRLSLVDRVEDVSVLAFRAAGGVPVVSIGGRLLPAIHMAGPEHANDDDNMVTCLRVRDGVRELCYPVRSIIDIVDVPAALAMELPHDYVAGLALVDGRQIEVIDSLALMARVPERIEGEPDAPRCVILDGEDRWNSEILAPLLVQAGYRVEFGLQAGLEGAVVLASATQELPEVAMAGAPVVRLRATGTADPAEDSIFRYDRDALLKGIARAREARKVNG